MGSVSECFGRKPAPAKIVRNKTALMDTIRLNQIRVGEENPYVETGEPAVKIQLLACVRNRTA
jgi:hypothetical protein